MERDNVREAFDRGLAVPRSLVPALAGLQGLSAPRVWGRNDDIADSAEAVWDMGGDYNYPALLALEVVSDSTDDDGGAATLRVSGVDSLGNEVSEDVELDGQTPVALTTAFARVSSVEVTGDPVAGTVSLFSGSATAGVPDDADLVMATVAPAGEGVTIVGDDGAAFPTMYACSNNADDADSGTGAIEVTVYGLDADWDAIEEVVALDGQTPVPLTKKFSRVHRAAVTRSGSAYTNAGVIYVASSGDFTSGDPDDASFVHSAILPGQGESHQATYTVPNGYGAYVERAECHAVPAAGESATVEIHVREAGGAFRVYESYTVATGGGHAADHSGAAIPLPSRADVEVRALTSDGTAVVCAALTVLLVQREFSDQ